MKQPGNGRRDYADDALTGAIIVAAIEAHRVLGPGLLESSYEECLSYELNAAGVPFERQVILPIVYKTIRLARAYRVDLLVGGQVIVELKTVDKILHEHEIQVLTYLKLSSLERGLIINFNAVPLKSGIRRLNRAASPVSPVSPFSPLSPEEISRHSDHFLPGRLSSA